MNAKKLSEESTTGLRALIDEACANSQIDLPFAEVVIVGDGHHYASDLFEYSTGPRGTTNDIFWLASCTKLVTAIACMQLVEQGKLALDSLNEIEHYCPELRDVKVIQDDGSLTEKKRGITLRMLLTHTAGFGYSMLNPKLKKYGLERRDHIGEYDEFSGHFADLDQPLVNQPGERFEYGIGVDWAGILVERVTGLKLNEYMRRYIFEPLQIEDLSMAPPAEMVSRCAGIYQRSKDGALSPRPYPLRKALQAESREDVFHSGGAGLFGSVSEYGKILGVLLNNGICSKSGKQILKSSTVEQMFTNQLPHQPDFARRSLPAVKPELVYPAEELYPLCQPSSPQGWGLSFMISPGVTGRSDTTVHWSGLSNVFWWCDRAKGVAGIVASQVLPFVDPKAGELWVKVESKVYESL